MFDLHRQISLFPQFGFSGRCLFVAGSMLMAFATHASTGMVEATYPQQVVITTGIVALNQGGPFNTILVITRSGDRYPFVGMAYDRIKARTFSGTVDADKVAKLVAAMQAPLQPTFTFASLGAQNAPVLREVEARIHQSLAATNLSKGQKALLESVSRDPAAIEAAISESLPITHSDDYPSISVDVVMSDNSELFAQGGSQHLFMLPWNIKGRGKTFNPAIAKALYDVLPKDELIRYRLRLKRIRSDDPVMPVDSADSFYQMFQSGMGNKLKVIGLQDRAGAAIAALKGMFVVGDAQYFADAAEPGARRSGSLQVSLTPLVGPPNLHATHVSFKVVAGRATNLREDTARVQALFGMVEHTPVIMHKITSDPTVGYFLNRLRDVVFHGNRSLADDMQEAGVPSLTREQLQGAVLVSRSGKKQGAFWVILPDGRTVRLLWVGSVDAHVDHAPCIGHRFAVDLCVGHIHSPDGKLDH